MVPVHILDPEDNHAAVANRFKWVDAKHARITTKEGLEVKFKVDKTFDVVSFNQFPLFDS